MTKRPLRHGFTTGACAAAAAKGAALMLREQRLVDEVELVLPAGIAHRFPLHGQRLTDREAACYVIKDAGDDPDVTHGCQIEVAIGVEFFTPNRIVIRGGPGIGRVTKPGLAVPVGEWAINPVPRRMIETAIHEVLAMRCMPATFTVTVSIPDGEARARRTLNARLGILGGLSILGTTGIVTPVSHQAWTDTIDSALDVAVAGGSRTVVLATGRTSERAAQEMLLRSGAGAGLPEEAFIMMGDHLGHALAACHRRGLPRLVLATQFAKLVKIAAGHRQTHAARAELELAELARWARESAIDVPPALPVELGHTAREIYLALGPGHPLVAEVARRALHHLEALAPGAEIALLLAGYDGRPAVRFGAWPEKER